MKVGVCLPYSEPGISRQTLLDWCRALEDGPFESVSCGERMQGADSVDMRILMAGAAAITNRIRIVPTLYVLPMHNAVRAAKEIASLDLISGGRVDVVVGTGGRPGDYQAVGMEWKGREQRLPGQVQVMRETWQGKPPFEGVDPIGPKPPHTPRVIAGFAGPKAITKSAEWADGLYAFSITGVAAEIGEKIATFDQARRAAGKTGKPWNIGGFWYSLNDDAEQHLRHYTYEYLKVAGHDMATAVANSMTQFKPDLILDTMKGMRDTGIDEIFMVPASAHVNEVKRLGDLVAKL